LVVHDIDGRAYSFDRLTKAVGVLLDRAVAAGQIRVDISPEDLLRALVGMCYMHDQPGWQASVLRLADVFIDGMSQEANTSSDNRPSRVLYLCIAPYGPQGRSHRLQMVARRVLDAPGLSHMRRPTGQPSFR
jgi:hypothetical protein